MKRGSAAERAVDDDCHLQGETFGFTQFHRSSKFPQTAAQFRFVFYGDFSSGVTLVGVFSRDVDLRTTPVTGARNTLADPFQLRVELSFGRSFVSCANAIPVLPKVLVLSAKERFDELVLGSKMAIQTRFGNARTFHDEVHADRSRAFAIEQLAGRPENSLSHVLTTGLRCIHDTILPQALDKRYRSVA